MTYFLVFRYMRRGEVHDGNTVMSFERPIATESDIRSIEAELATERGVDAGELGLTNLVSLD